MGGQLQGKGVDVENYPGLHNMTGPGVVASMRNQAAKFGAVFEVDIVHRIDISKRPFTVYTNASVISTHSIIVATGAESRWLGVPGEYEMRGGGVSSCATCDGAAFYKKDVLVVGGGDSAMEDALVLARTSKSVTIIHRRDEFRASKILAKRVLEHPTIKVLWNTTVVEIVGDFVDENPSDLDETEDSTAKEEKKKIVTAVILRNHRNAELTKLRCDAVFVAIGHDPNTSFLHGIVDFDDEHPGYIKTHDKSTKTSVPGIFAAGDVSDAIYRQAITSAGSGAAAALDAERWLSENDLGNEAAELEAELMAEMLADDNTRGSAAHQYNVYEDTFVKGIKESTRGEL
jgi:thioredoxin reductase (NADPH)